jgi:hypothetical protein
MTIFEVIKSAFEKMRLQAGRLKKKICLSPALVGRVIFIKRNKLIFSNFFVSGGVFWSLFLL